MYSPEKFILQDQTLWLSPERCIFWEEEKALILSDLHFGKTGHFRKSGIGIPQNIFKNDLQRLFNLIQFFQPYSLLIAGDMFHSHANKEIDLFVKWRKDLPGINFNLIKGNHDILPDNFYADAQIKNYKNFVSIKNFSFTHDITAINDKDNSNKFFTFSGHIHPGIRVNGAGKQSLMLPCFYFTDAYAVLPAFSHFTGLYKMSPKKKDHVFAIIENKVVKM